jgi:hypothetical protein
MISPLPFPGTILSKTGPAISPRQVIADAIIISLDSCGIFNMPNKSCDHLISLISMTANSSVQLGKLIKHHVKVEAGSYTTTYP